MTDLQSRYDKLTRAIDRLREMRRQVKQLLDGYKRQIRYQKKLTNEGKCPHCRRSTEPNPRTGKPYTFCADERARRKDHARMSRAEHNDK